VYDRPILEVALAADKFGRRYRRGGPWAVRDVTLSVPPGSITALVGPNGAGKSTLIRSWMGFERPDEGAVLVRGVDPRRRRAEAIASIGYVPQSTALYQGLTINDHIRLVKSYRPGFDRPAAVRRLEGLGLALPRSTSQLSGGEKAQVALTLALAMGVPILLLDEPLASLDPLARRDFLGMLTEDVQHSGATVVLSSHIVTDVEQACDALIVLSQGRLVLHDTIAGVRAQHVTVPAGALDGREPVSTFAGPTGKRLALVRMPAPPGQEATLEEVVLGYLSSPKRAAS